MINAKRLACLLWSYEADEPHEGEWESYFYPKVTESDLDKHLAEDHEGDCIGEPSPCNRCYAEQVMHKASWLAERLNEADSV